MPEPKTMSEEQETRIREANERLVAAQDELSKATQSLREVRAAVFEEIGVE